MPLGHISNTFAPSSEKEGEPGMLRQPACACQHFSALPCTICVAPPPIGCARACCCLCARPKHCTTRMVRTSYAAFSAYNLLSANPASSRASDDVKPHVCWETPRGRYDVVQQQFSLSKNPRLSIQEELESSQKVASCKCGATPVLTWNLHTTQSSYFAPKKQEGCQSPRLAEKTKD